MGGAERQTCLAEKGPSSLMYTVLRGVPSTGAMTRLKVCLTLSSSLSVLPLSIHSTAKFSKCIYNNCYPKEKGFVSVTPCPCVHEAKAELSRHWHQTHPVAKFDHL